MILLVYGDDAFRVKEKAKGFVDHFIGKFDPTKMNVDEISFAKKDEVSLAKVAEAISASPFLSTKRMVRIDGLFATVTTKPEAEAWTPMLARTPESTFLVIVDTLGKEKVEKTELWKKISAMQDVHLNPFPALSGSDLRTWVQARAKAHGAVLVPDVADTLIARIGNDSWRLETEIAKLSAYAGDAPIIDSMIDALVTREYSEDIFGLMDAMGSDRPAFALKKLHDEREAGNEDFPLFAMLVRQIRLLLQTRALIDERQSVGKQDVADAFSMNPYVAQKVLGEAKRRSLSTIIAWHTKAAELDIAMKRGLDPSIAVDTLAAIMLDAN